MMKIFHLYLPISLLVSLCLGIGCGGSTPADTETVSAPASDTPALDTDVSSASDTAAEDAAADTAENTADESVVAQNTEPAPEGTTAENASDNDADAEETTAAETAAPKKDTQAKSTEKNSQKKTASDKKAITPPPRGVFQGHPSYTFMAKNGNVTFSHNAHKSVTTCKKCHHGKEKGIAPPACRSCHGKGSGPSFKDVAHKQCKSCHKQKGMDTGCKSCHEK